MYSKLVDEGENRADEVVHGRPIQILLHHRGHEIHQERRCKEHSQPTVFSAEQIHPEDDVDAVVDNEEED